MEQKSTMSTEEVVVSMNLKLLATYAFINLIIIKIIFDN